MPLPPAHFLIGAGAADLASAGSTLPRLRVWLAGGLVALLPDMDTGLGVLLGQGNAFHGLYTHTLAALFGILAVVFLVAGIRWAGVAASAYGSHLMIDLLEDRGATSVQLWWPFSQQRSNSIAPLFPSVPWRQGEGPQGAAISLLEAEVFPSLVSQTAVALGIFLTALLLTRLLWRSARKSAAGSNRS